MYQQLAEGMRSKEGLSLHQKVFEDLESTLAADLGSTLAEGLCQLEVAD